MQRRMLLLIVLTLPLLAPITGARTQSDCGAATAALERRVEAQRRMLADWAGLTRYGSENTELKPAPAGSDRVVFIGDDVTENWASIRSGFFMGKSFINRGARGQTTPQMLVRFRQDVISLKPRAVVILGGTNDVASLAGPITQAMTAENIMSMVELAKAHSIRVVLASVTPVCDCYTKQTVLRPHGKIIGLNSWLKEYAAESGSTYLDLYAALAEGRNLRKEFTDDGVLLNEAGYAAISPLTERTITQALMK